MTSAPATKFDGKFQRLEFVDEKSSKFWEIRLSGKTVEVCYGKIGTAGQTQTKVFADTAAARKHAEKIVGEKLKGGYLEPVATRASKSAAKTSAATAPRSTQGDSAFFLDLTDGSEIELTHIPGISLPGLPREVRIAGLRNLKVIHLDETKGLTWLNLESLPNLVSVVICGDVKLIRVTSAEQLTYVDVSQCPQLERLVFDRAFKLTTLKIDSCRRLSKVDGLDAKMLKQLGIEAQIDKVQAQSKKDLSLYPNMTITDIDMALKGINHGVEIAKEVGLYIDVDEREDFVPDQFEIRLCHDLANARAMHGDGTGEVYAHELVVFQPSSDQNVWRYIMHTRGYAEPEEALSAALNWLVSNGLRIPEGEESEETRALSLLKRLVGATDTSVESIIQKIPDTVGDVASVVKVALQAADDPDKRCLNLFQSTAWWPFVSLWQRMGGKEYFWTVLSMLSPGLVENLRQRTILQKDKAGMDLMAIYSTNSDIPKSPPVPSIFPVDGAEAVAMVFASTDLASNNKNELLKSVHAQATAKSLIDRMKVAKDETTPLEILELMSTDKSADIRYCIACNASTAPFILEKLSADKNTDVRVVIANNARTSVEILERLSDDKSVGVCCAVAENLSTPDHLLERLAKRKESLVRLAVARNPSASLRILQTLVIDKSSDVRASVASNSLLPIDLLEKLAVDSDENVRRFVAANKSCPAELLESLARDVSSEVRRYVAMNGRTPDLVLNVLAKDKVADVRSYIAENPMVTSVLLARLALDNSVKVREVVASKAATPRAALTRLVADREHHVSRAATETLSTLPMHEASDSATSPLGMPGSSLLESDIWTELQIAANQSTSVKRLLALACSEAAPWFVRATALRNPKYPEESRMAGQAALEKSVLKALDDEADEKLRGRKLEESDFSEFRLLIGRALSGLDKDKVLDLVVSNDSSERACATCCPSLSPKLLHLMLEDTSQTVREMAAYRLLHPLHLFSEEGPEI